jgi:hypothetical protein
MEAEHSWWIPGNVPSLKNGKLWTGKFLVSQPSVKKWQKISKESWEKQKEEFRSIIRPLPRPYFIHFTFYREHNRLFDYTAPIETIADEMVRQGWVNDDNVHEFVPLVGRFIQSKERPGTIIRVAKLPRYEFY